MASNAKAKFVSWSPAPGGLAWILLDGPDFVCTGRWLAERNVKPCYTVNVSSFQIAYLITREDAGILLGLE